MIRFSSLMPLLGSFSARLTETRQRLFRPCSLELTRVTGLLALLCLGLSSTVNAGWIQSGESWTMDSGMVRLDPASTPAFIEHGPEGWVIAAEGSLRIAELSLPGSVRVQAERLELRDAPGQPLRVRAMGSLSLEAELIDIVALSDPESWIESAASLYLISPRPIRGDAHFRAGGNLRFQDRNGRPQALHSPEDPILLALGDVSMFNYVGASLHILAGGSIEITDVVEITEAETDPLHAIHRFNSALFNASEEISSLSEFLLSDGTGIEVDGYQRPTIDLRAGVEWRNFDGGEPVPGWIGAGPPAGLNPDPPEHAHINVGSLLIQPDILAQGMVLLTNRYRSHPGLTGNIVVGAINGLAIGEEAHGAEVFIDSTGGIQTGAIDTRAQADQLALGGGNVRLLAEGTVVIDGISSAGSVQHSGHHGGGGHVRLLSRQASVIAPALATGFEFDDRAVWTGPAGNIEISAPMGNVHLPGLRVFSANVNSFNDPAVIVGGGGDIRIQAGRSLISSELSLLAQSDAEYGATTGNGGRIELEVGEDNIALVQVLGHSLAGIGNVSGSGGIQMAANDGSILIGQMLRSDARASTGRVTTASGDIDLTAVGSVLIGGELRTEVLGQQSTQNAGMIKVFSQNGDIELGDISAWTAAEDETGDGGDIVLTTLVGQIEVGDIEAKMGHGLTPNTGGRGGNITLRADAGIKTGEIRASQNLGSGLFDVGGSGNIDLETRFGDIEFAAADTSILANVNPGSTIGRAGSVRMHAVHGWIRTPANRIWTYTYMTGIDARIGGGGDIELVAGGGVEWPQGFYLFTDARGSELAEPSGSVRIVVGNGDLSMSFIDAFTLSWSGAAIAGSGSVELRAEQGAVIMNDIMGGVLSHAGSIASPAGDVHVYGRDGITLLSVSSYARVSEGNGDVAGGGLISLHSSLGDIQVLAALDSSSVHNEPASASSTTVGSAGDIHLDAPQGSIQVSGLSAHSSTAGAASPGNGGELRLIAGEDIEIGAPGLTSSSIAALETTPTQSAGEIALRSTGGSVAVLGPILANAQSGGLATGHAGAIEIEGNIVTTRDVYAHGLAGSGSITIRHGGNGVEPFIVADPAPPNSSTGLYTTEASITPDAFFLLSHHEPPNIWILTEDPPEYVVGGSVSGLVGSGLILRNNGGDDLAVTSNGSFEFATPLPDLAAYDVSVHVQPSAPMQSCQVLNGTGQIAGAPVTNIQVQCETLTFPVSGSVQGLAGTGLVLRNNDGDDLPISNNGPFQFATPLPDMGNYSVTVHIQPGSPAQLCSVTNGSGQISGAPATDIEVSCETLSFPVSGSVQGLAGTGLVLRNNDGDDLPVSNNGPFQFAIPVEDGGAYHVTVFSVPVDPTQHCSVANGSGTIAGGPVTDVLVSCTTEELDTTVSLAAPAQPPRAGQPVEFLIEVSASTAPDAGSVTLLASTGETCSAPAPVATSGNTSSWSCSLSFGSFGPRSLTASYAGSPGFQPGQSDPVSVTAMRYADIQVSVDAGAESGGDVAYLLRVENAGPDPAPGTSVQAMASPVLADAQWTCFEIDATCPAGSGMGMPMLDIDLPPGSALEFLIEGSYGSSLPPQASLMGWATVDPDAPNFVFDPDSGNNEDSATYESDRIFSDAFRAP